MAYGLPARGQADWDDELNNSMEALRGDVQAAKSDVTVAKSDAAYARNRADAVHTAVIGTADAATAGFVNDPTSATRGALSVMIETEVLDRALSRFDIIDVVVDHGALRDGTGLIATQAAFNNAIAAANLRGGNVVIRIPDGTFELSTGLTQNVTANYVFFQGASPGATTLRVQSGKTFTWSGNAVGGGLSDVGVVAVTPAADQCLIHINGASSQKFRRIFLDNVRQLARLGEAGANASAPSFTHIYGSTDPNAGSVVIDAGFGTALHLDDVVVNAKGVGFPTDATSAHPAADTTFLKFGRGAWDTVHANAVLVNRYNRGLDIDGSAATAENIVTLVNFWFTACAFDYSKTHGIRIQTNNTAATIRTLRFTACWAVATDNHSIEVSATGGWIRNVLFRDCIGRQAGKNSWRLSGGFMDRVKLLDCHGMGSNRLASTNTSNNQDDLVILGGGVEVRGGSYGEDGSSYTGLPHTTRYGVTRAADIAIRVTDAEFDGVSGGFAPGFASNAVADKRSLVTRNRRATNASPDYATTTVVAAPASTSLQTHLNCTIDTLRIYGGTVTAVNHNGTQVADGPTALLLQPGDTWAITYSAAPTIKRIVHP
jgi:hypothetical protein